MEPVPDPDRDSLEELVALALDRLEESGAAGLEALYAEHPERAEDLRQRVGWLLETGLARPAAPESSVPERLGDFRLLEPLGEGGMGVVWRAEQLSLGREVALKLVRPEQLYFPGALDRFRHEVLTVAGLAHPGIVPIFAVGEEGGLPFFAMERVRGASLGAVLAQLAGRDPRALGGADLLQALDELGADPREEASSLFEGPWPSVCARIVREVAEALEHAHRRGVLHRDVKPSNVMLSRGGRVMLLDFGLASSGEDRRRTRTGQRVGTLAYMPPEQLRGERELDARADVVALGVTLYELLGLRLPYESSAELARSTREGRSVPADLRKRDPRIGWELETVVLTATDPEPTRRYATAAELARDLSRVLENRPIEARRSSFWLLARRWVQRHPAAAFALVLVVVGPTLFAWQQARAREAVAGKSEELRLSNVALSDALDEVTVQRDAALEASDRAQRHFERAYDAVELMLAQVGGEVLVEVPHMEPIRRELLGAALRMLEELRGEQTGGREQRALEARTLRRTAALRAELGDLAGSLEALDGEALVLDALLAEGAEPELELRRGALAYRRAQVRRLRGELALAEESAREAVERLGELALRDPGASDPAWELGRARMELAQILNQDQRESEGRAVLGEAVDELLGSGILERGSWEERRELAKAVHLMAATPKLYVEGQARPFDPNVAAAHLEQALDLRRRLVEERPEIASSRLALAETLLALGVMRSTQ